MNSVKNVMADNHIRKASALALLNALLSAWEQDNAHLPQAASSAIIDIIEMIEEL